jgi:uracil-DNA glycosylase
VTFPDNLPPGWKTRLSAEAEKEYFKNLVRFLAAEHRRGQIIYPKKEWVLRALQSVDYDQVKVVILGQDPYHGPGQAIGLSFAVPNELSPKPPSLQNIFKELSSDLGCALPPHQSDLTGWASQGVLLLNTVLTVRKGEPLSHKDAGWEFFTDQIIRLLNERKSPVVFILWGSSAQKKKALIQQAKHFIIESPHPSPLSAHRGFFGSRPFSKVNSILTQNLKLTPIDWIRISDEK